MPKQKWASIDSDDGLWPNRRETIMWVYGGLLYLCIYALLSLDEFHTELLLWTSDMKRLYHKPTFKSDAATGYEQ